MTQDITATFTRLITAIEDPSLPRQTPLRELFMTLHHLVWTVCTLTPPENDRKRYMQMMYERFKAELSGYLRDYVLPAVRPAGGGDVGLLRTLRQRWDRYRIVTQCAVRAFCYLDKYHTALAPGYRVAYSMEMSNGASDDGPVPGLITQAMVLFDQQVLEPLRDAVHYAILSCVREERGGGSVDRFLLKNIIDMILTVDEFAAQALIDEKACAELKMSTGPAAAARSSMGTSPSHILAPALRAPVNKFQRYERLEALLLVQAAEYYLHKAGEWSSLSCDKYLTSCERAFTEERGRCDAYLRKSTRAALDNVVYTKLVAHELMAKLARPTDGLHELLTQSALSQLSRLYRLTEGHSVELDAVAAQLKEHVASAGRQVLDLHLASARAAAPLMAAGPGEGCSFIRDIITCYAKYVDIVQVAFVLNPTFTSVLRKTFSDTINTDSVISKLLAQFLGQLLQPQTSCSVLPTLGTFMEHAVQLYGLILDKDIFEYEYQIQLQERLLHGKCQMDLEQTAINKLKHQAGYQWTNKLEVMFKDMNASQELTAHWRTLFAARRGRLDWADLREHTEFKVCTTGSWPACKTFSNEAKLPEGPQSCFDSFREFYMLKHAGRRVQCALFFGRAEVKVQFSPTVARTLVVTTIQMMLILAFNAQKVLSVQQLLDATGLKAEDLSNDLVSLCHPKVRVLLKSPNNATVTATDRLMINGKYQNPSLKIVIPSFKATTTPAQPAPVLEAHIEAGRRHQIEAVIVRIMKNRKEMKHADLLAEVIAQLTPRFRPQPAQIKKTIEALIEREYMERDANVRTLYHYMA